MRLVRTVLPQVACGLGVLLTLIAGAPPVQAQQWRPPSQRSTAPSLNQAPAPRNEPRSAARPGYVWVPGHWEWTARNGAVWVAGRHIRDRPGFRYVGPQWTLRNGEWVFVPGRWVR